MIEEEFDDDAKNILSNFDDEFDSMDDDQAPVNSNNIEDDDELDSMDDDQAPVNSNDIEDDDELDSMDDDQAPVNSNDIEDDDELDSMDDDQAPVNSNKNSDKKISERNTQIENILTTINAFKSPLSQDKEANHFKKKFLAVFNEIKELEKIKEPSIYDQKKLKLLKEQEEHIYKKLRP